MEWVVWLAAFVILIGIEAATLNLCTIWFAIGALVSFFLTFTGMERYGQVAVFFIVSCVLLIFTRPLAVRYINKNTVKTNVEGLIGKKARITAPRGQLWWRARSGRPAPQTEAPLRRALWLRSQRFRESN